MLIHESERELLIPDRFQGLPELTHGGYLAGLLADALGVGQVTVRLRRPVPTGRRLLLRRSAAGAELRDGETVLVTAAAQARPVQIPVGVSGVEAAEAARRFLGRREHPIPDCLVCGTNRAEGEGLRIFPGPVSGRRVVAAPWRPTAPSGEIGPELTSAALDCTQLWALIAHAPSGTRERAVTAELQLRLRAPVRADLPHVVIGWPIELGRGAWVAGAAIFDPDGELCAAGRQRAALTSWGVPMGWRPGESNFQADEERNHFEHA